MNILKKCPRCGAFLVGNARYCGKCGCDTAESVVNERVPELRQSSQPAETPRPVEPSQPVETPRPADTPRPVETARIFPAQEKKTAPPWSDRGGRFAGKSLSFLAENRKLLAVVAAAALVLILGLVLILRAIVRPRTAELPAAVAVSETAEPGATPEGMHVIAAGDSVATPVPATPTPPSVNTPVPATAPPAATGPVVNEASGVAYALADQVRVYAGPGQNYEVIGTAARDEELVRTGVTDGWTRVDFEGRDGFVLNSDLTLTQPTPTPTASPLPEGFEVDHLDDTVAIIGTTANLRRGPGTDFPVSVNLPAGTELHRTGTYEGWSQVSYNGETLYITEMLIEEKDSATPAPVTPSPAADEEAAGSITLYVNANVRTGPGTDYDVLGLAEGGATLPTSGREGDWYRVTWNGQTGYVFADLVE